MRLMQALYDIDAKRFLRVSWVAHLGFMIAVSAVIVFASPDRMDEWMMVAPALLGGIALEGAAAAGGSALKRITTKAEKPNGDRGVSGEKTDV